MDVIQFSSITSQSLTRKEVPGETAEGVYLLRKNFWRFGQVQLENTLIRVDAIRRTGANFKKPKNRIFNANTTQGFGGWPRDAEWIFLEKMIFNETIEKERLSEVLFID